LSGEFNETGFGASLSRQFLDGQKYNEAGERRKMFGGAGDKGRGWSGNSDFGFSKIKAYFLVF